MSRTVDLPALKTRSASLLSHAVQRYETAINDNLPYLMLRWTAKMTAVEMHAVWERYVESRLVTALNHNPKHFISENNIKGVKRVSAGLAFYLVRGGGKYFDFRSMSDLFGKADTLLGRNNNPFRVVSTHDRAYIDTLSAIRNCIVHGSEAAATAYKRSLNSVYGIRSAPEPDEFLHARDMRTNSPARYRSRLHGLAVVVTHAIQNT